MSIMSIKHKLAYSILGAGLFLCLAPLSLAEEGKDVPAPPPKLGLKLRPPFYVFNPDLPRDVVTLNVGSNGTQTFVNNLAWNAFIALNWPVPQELDEQGVPKPLAHRGIPDRQNVIGGLKYGGDGFPKFKPNGPVVWETFKNTEDIFLPSAAKPTSFDTPPVIPAACTALLKKNPAAGQHLLSNAAQTTSVLELTDQAFTESPLIDQNGQKVWYEVKVNRAYYDYVVGNGFYNKNNQAKKKIDFPASSNTTMTEPVVRVKAAWKVIGAGDDKSRFYTTSALLYDKKHSTCHEQTVGLVGLHVVQKTEQFQQWSWATFEHVDNAPDKDTAPAPGVHYNFYNPTCSPAQCPPNVAPPKDGPFPPTQVVREVKLPSTSLETNEVFQSALISLRTDNVWQHYMLIDAQWGPLTKETPMGTPALPHFLANTTMETYLQSPTEDPGQPHGCINCHGKFAASKDMDFQLYKAAPHTQSVDNLLKSFMH